MSVDITSLLLGFAIGALLSVLFFGGLAYGVQLALRSSRPAIVLLAGALCRISLLLAAGYALVVVRGNGWPLIGFVIAFFLVRLVATFWAHSASTSTSTSTNANREGAECS